MTSFINAGGRRTLLLLYQKGESPKLGEWLYSATICWEFFYLVTESGRPILKQEIIMKVFVTNGNDQVTSGKVLFFIKPKKEKALNYKTMNEVRVERGK